MLQLQLIWVINTVARVFYVVLLVRIIFSWINLQRAHPLLRTINRITYAFTEPLLRPIRNQLLRFQRGMPIDFSPIVAWFIIELIRALLIRLVRML